MGNILIDDGELVAMIDFGTSGIGPRRATYSAIEIPVSHAAVARST